jgi:hypothetical protein
MPGLADTCHDPSQASLQAPLCLEAELEQSPLFVVVIRPILLSVVSCFEITSTCDIDLILNGLAFPCTHTSCFLTAGFWNPSALARA